MTSPGPTTDRRTRRHTMRTSARADLPRIADLLARAFADDPVVAWGLPRVHDRAHRSRRSFELIAELAHPKGHVYVDTRLRCASLWSPPGDLGPSPTQLLTHLPRLAAIYRARLPLVVAGLVTVQRRRPAQPHWYLSYLGTDPNHQGTGLGSAALAPVLERCDRDGTPAYLEASKPSLVPFYVRAGFEVVDQLTLPAGPTVTAMWREPRTTPR